MIKIFYFNFLNHYILRFLKVTLPILFLGLLYKYSYISLEPIKSLFLYGDIKLILLILIFTFSCSLFLYFRFIYCLKIYKLNVNLLKQIRICSQAYSFASFIPGPIGIDAWRIGKLRNLDLSKYKTNLIKATILEKIFALFNQIFILIFFIIDDSFIKTVLILLSYLFLFILISLLKYLGRKSIFIYKYSKNINFKKISILFSICTITNLISCYLIRFIGITLNMNFSLKVMSISSILSNMATIIPISPSGLGISEFVFSKMTQNILNLDTNNSIATIYFSYRILNLLSHFLIYYIIKIIEWMKNKRRLKLG